MEDENDKIGLHRPDDWQFLAGEDFCYRWDMETQFRNVRAVVNTIMGY